MSSSVTITWPDVPAYMAMVEHHRREGEERERRAIGRWLRLRAHETRAPLAACAFSELAGIIERNEHEEHWNEALAFAGIDKDDA